MIDKNLHAPNLSRSRSLTLKQKKTERSTYEKRIEKSRETSQHVSQILKTKNKSDKGNKENKLREVVCNFQESGDRSKNSTFFLFAPKDPFGELFSKIIFKSSSEFLFWQKIRKFEIGQNVPNLHNFYRAFSAFTWQIVTSANRVTLLGRPGNPPRRLTPLIM